VAVEMASFPNRGPPLNGDVEIERGSGADARIWADDAIGADVSFGRNFAGTVNDRCWMYRHF